MITVFAKYAAHAGDTFSRLRSPEYVEGEPKAAGDALVANQSLRIEQAHRRSSFPYDSKSGTSEQASPFSGYKWLDTYVNIR